MTTTNARQEGRMEGRARGIKRGVNHFGLQRTARKRYTWKVFLLFNCMLASFQQQLCGLVLADLMCARTSDTHASTCLMCARVLRENDKPQEAPKGLEFITEWTNDWWCSIHYSELHWIINNSWWINKTCIWYWTAGIIPMCIFFFFSTNMRCQRNNWLSFFKIYILEDVCVTKRCGISRCPQSSVGWWGIRDKSSEEEWRETVCVYYCAYWQALNKNHV